MTSNQAPLGTRHTAHTTAHTTEVEVEADADAEVMHDIELH